MPIYLVKTPNEKKLVDANTKAQAINHVTKTTITAETVTASEVVELMQSGIQVEKAEVLRAPAESATVAAAAVDAGTPPASNS